MIQTASATAGAARPPALVAQVLRTYPVRVVDRWESFRRAVVAAREEKGWTQADLAKRAKVTRPALSGLETGKTRDPRGETIRRVSTALGWTEATIERLQRGERANGQRQPSPGEIAMARHQLPGAPLEALERYARLMSEVDPLWREIEALQRRYGRVERPASQPRGEGS